MEKTSITDTVKKTPVQHERVTRVQSVHRTVLECSEVNKQFCRLAKLGNSFRLLTRNILPMVMMILGLWTCAKATEPNLGVLYDYEAAIMKGIFAAPSEKRCRESFRSAELVKFKAEFRKYQVVRTIFQACYCDAQHIIKECDESFLGMPSRKLMKNFIPTTRRQC